MYDAGCMVNECFYASISLLTTKKKGSYAMLPVLLLWEPSELQSELT